mmetsp:Transcript_2785/g.5246  ORF Transcript_2785/g.5246 Transcript_2785/m.5246 type:complete len:202 (+) Transcript_2785:360-965(+)
MFASHAQHFTHKKLACAVRRSIATMIVRGRQLERAKLPTAHGVSAQFQSVNSNRHGAALRRVSYMRVTTRFVGVCGCIQRRRNRRWQRRVCSGVMYERRSDCRCRRRRRSSSHRRFALVQILPDETKIRRKHGHKINLLLGKQLTDHGTHRIADTRRKHVEQFVIERASSLIIHVNYARPKLFRSLKIRMKHGQIDDFLGE